jgi:hypothetical protein
MNPSGIAGNLLVYSSYAGGGDGFRLKGGADAYVAIYAPDACVALTGGPDLFGAIVSRCFANNGSADIHYDESLRRIRLGEILLSNWHEVRGG